MRRAGRDNLDDRRDQRPRGWRSRSGLPACRRKNTWRGLDRAVLARHLDWLVPHLRARADRLITSVHSWLIEPGITVLVDACAGNHKDRPGFCALSSARHPVP